MHIAAYAYAAAYASERPLFLDSFFKTQNLQLINKSGFKSRGAYDGARTVCFFDQLLI